MVANWIARAGPQSPLDGVQLDWRIGGETQSRAAEWAPTTILPLPYWLLRSWRSFPGTKLVGARAATATGATADVRYVHYCVVPGGTSRSSPTRTASTSTHLQHRTVPHRTGHLPQPWTGAQPSHTLHLHTQLPPRILRLTSNAKPGLEQDLFSSSTLLSRILDCRCDCTRCPLPPARTQNSICA
jgi:hypothetical protein